MLLLRKKMVKIKLCEVVYHENSQMYSVFIILIGSAFTLFTIFLSPPVEWIAVNDITTIESLQFDFKSIETATNKFSDYNMLGRGGFGDVYKVYI